MKGKRLILTILLMSVISWISFKGYEINYYQSLKPIVKHAINFSLLISVALIGCYALYPLPEKWMLTIWLLAYAAVIIVLVLIGVIDVFHRISNHLIRDSIAPVRMFFTSPFPFLLIIFLNRAVKKKEG